MPVSFRHGSRSSSNRPPAVARPTSDDDAMTSDLKRSALSSAAARATIASSASLLPRIFDLFTQEQQPLDRAAGGLGLGLAIVQSLVAMHDGSVTARSDHLGRGGEFIVELPAVPNEPLGPGY